MQAEPSQSAQVPTNEEEDLGQMYSSQWIRHHFTMAVESAPVPVPKQYCNCYSFSSLSPYPPYFF